MTIIPLVEFEHGNKIIFNMRDIKDHTVQRLRI